MKIKKMILDLKINIQTLYQVYAASPKYVLVNLFETFVSSVWGIYQIVFFQKIIDAVISQTFSTNHMVLSFLTYYFISLILYVFNYSVHCVFNEKEKLKIKKYYKHYIYNASVKNSYECLTKKEYMDKSYNAIYNDGDYLLLFTNNLSSFLRSIISFIGMLLCIGKIHGIFILSAFIIAIKNIQILDLENKFNYIIYQNNMMINRAKNYINNIFFLREYAKNIRFFHLGKLFRTKYEQVQSISWSINRKEHIKLCISSLVSLFFDNLIYVINIVILIFMVQNNQITIGEFNMVLASFGLLSTSIQNVFMFFISLSNDSKYIENINYVVKQNSNNNQLLKKNCHQYKDTIVCENVCFSYETTRNVVDIDYLLIPLNKKIALVGENGSGKSTFVKLLLGLIPLENGNISFYCDNEEKENFFSVMFQDFNVYAMSVADNISDSSNEKRDLIMRGIEFSELTEKISCLPRGIDTELTNEFSEEGIQLSGGEQQKIALARAYVNGNEVLILDEPSSNLDIKSERKIISKIKCLTENKSVIYVTHNMINALSADLIYYFSLGKIVEYGSPDDLIKVRGHFYHMLMEQKKSLNDNEMKEGNIK